jgi:hypothetical protein
LASLPNSPRADIRALALLTEKGRKRTIGRTPAPGRFASEPDAVVFPCHAGTGARESMSPSFFISDR